MRTWYKSYLIMCAGASDILAARCMASETNSFTADHVSAMRYSQPKLLKRYHELNSSVAQFKLWRFHCLLNLQLRNSLSFRCNTIWCSDVTDCKNKTRHGEAPIVLPGRLKQCLWLMASRSQSCTLQSARGPLRNGPVHIGEWTPRSSMSEFQIVLMQHYLQFRTNQKLIVTVSIFNSVLINEVHLPCLLFTDASLY